MLLTDTAPDWMRRILWILGPGSVGKSQITKFFRAFLNAHWIDIEGS